MNCAPAVIPDVSDQLTEAEVAEPGFNAVARRQRRRGWRRR